MEAHVERMIKEHKELMDRLFKLGNWISNPNNDDTKIEFALKYTQYHAMRIYEETLRNRLTLTGITIANGNYFNTPIETPKEESNNTTSDNITSEK